MTRYAIAFLVLLLFITTLHAQPKSRAGWLSDFNAAKLEAKQSGKPLFVVIRCEQCEDCREFDAKVTALDKAIAPAAEKFVRVKLGRINGLDLRTFDFDYDNVWFALLMNADGHVYGRYGGRDNVDAEGRLSLPGLRFALDAALAAHAEPPKAIDLMGKPVTVSDLATGRKVRGNCIHCHNVNEFTLASLKAEGKLDRDRFWSYPLPENVGLVLDVDEGNRVKKVVAESAAAKAGIKADDRIRTINGTPVASFADVSYSLHKAPKQGDVPIEWMSGAANKSGTLKLAEGWRVTDLGWRPSLTDYLPRLEFSGADLKPEEKKQLGLAEKRLAFRQDKFVHSTLKVAGIQKDDIVLGIDGKETTGTMADFLKHVHGQYIVGDKVTLNVVRDGKRVEVAMTLR